MADFNINAFPQLRGGPRRTLYFLGLDPMYANELVSRGYEPVELMSMPRQTPQDHVAYLYAKCQAVEEGTIDCSPDERKALELEMKAHGLLDKKSQSLKVNVDVDADSVEALLNWGADRHTLRGNTTVVMKELYEGKDE